MTRRDLKMIWIAAGLMVLMLLVPPWHVRQETRTTQGQLMSTSGGVEYAPIFDPPGPRWATEVTLAEGQLLMQWAGVAALLGPLLLTLRSRKR